MEALILIFGELVFAMLAPFVVLVVELIGSILGLTLSFGFGKRAQSAVSSRAFRMIAMTLIALAAIVLSALWLVNSFYFDNAVRQVFVMAEKRSGIATTCEEVDGSLFAGRIDLRNCAIRRPSHPTAAFALSLEQATLDLRVTSLLGTAHIDTARVVGLDGWISSDRSGGAENPEKHEKPRRAFVIGQLDVSDVKIEIAGTNADGNPFRLPIEIGRIESQPLRSRLALFDILFRSNASGLIAAAPFEISTSAVGDGRETTWRALNVPVANFGAMTGGPLSWFSSGSVDVFVDDKWQRGDSLSIDMDWRLNFKDLKVEAPHGSGAIARMAAKPLTRYVNSLDGQLPLEFEMVVNESQFEYKSSLAAAGLWSALGESVKKVLGALGVDPEKASETGDAIKEGAKSVLDRLRKPNSDARDEPGSD